MKTSEATTGPSRRAVSRLAAFRHAFAGWWHMLRTQPNAWIHSLVSVAVFILAAWLGLSTLEWAIIFLTVGFVWVAEFLNTAIEAVVDLASPNIHPLAKVGKDVGAAAVLVAALSAVLIGLLVLGPPLWARLF
ncbi:MAG: diacylglycerol kinase family protein [Anaerolineales bacterium]|nr:diacylglycerol kinase family protein [Anaerolineales bacterium]